MTDRMLLLLFLCEDVHSCNSGRDLGALQKVTPLAVSGHSLTTLLLLFRLNSQNSTAPSHTMTSGVTSGGPAGVIPTRRLVAAADQHQQRVMRWNDLL